MNTYDFLKLILPKGGLKIVAELIVVPGRDRPAWRYTAHRSIEGMAQAIAQLDAAGKTIYYACAGYGDWYDAEVKGVMKRRIRTQANVVACRSLYDDIDIGKKDCYTSKKEAVGEVARFIAEVGLPTPTLVDSGGGIHIYWSLTEDATPAEWQELAALKRLATRKFGLRVDGSVDLDSARVLRPVGATWRKNGERTVTAKYVAEPVEREALIAILRQYVGEVDVAVLPQRRASRFAMTNDLAAVEYPPSSLELVAERCEQIRQFRDTGGESEPVWYAALGVAKHCTDGEALAHQWSKQYPGYIREETQAKLEQWPHGPATCAKFQELNASGCAGCTMNVSSPIQLGYAATGTAPVVTKITQVDEPMQPALAAAEAGETPALVEPAPSIEDMWPDKYRCANGALSTLVEDKDTGVPFWQEFARPPFYPVGRVRNEDDTYTLVIRYEVRPDEWRETDIPTKHIADARAMRIALASKEIIVSNDKLAFAFMSTFLEKLRQNVQEVCTYTQFGWHNDYTEFLIGNTVITQDGTRTVRVGKRVTDRDLLAAFNPQGTVEDWVNGVDFLYNRPNGEPYQYTIATAFGAALTPLLHRAEWNGIPLALTSDASGLGKTSVCTIGLNIYTEASKVIVADCTPKAVPGRASIMNHVPTLYDEVTNTLKEADPLADVLYALANGRPRVGMTVGGQEREAAPPWKLMSFITGNKNLTYQLTDTQFNSEAVQMRLFEIPLDEYPRLASVSEEESDIKAECAAISQRLMNRNSCVVGIEYIRWVMANRTLVEDALETQFTKLSAAVNARGGNASKERFFIYHLTCAMTGALVAQRMGLIKFDLKVLRDWALNHIDRMREAAKSYNQNVQESLSAFLADLHGHVLVTNAYHSLDARVGKTELPIIHLRGAVKARLVLGTATEAGRLLISHTAISEWCKTKGISPLKFRRDLMAGNFVKLVDGDATQRVYLCKGVPTVPGGLTRALEFDQAVAQGFIETHVTAANVVALRDSKDTPVQEGDPEERSA